MPAWPRSACGSPTSSPAACGLPQPPSTAGVNEYLTRLAEAATDPDLAGDPWSRTKERLARAGLLVEPGPSLWRKQRTRELPGRLAADLVNRFERDWFGDDDGDPRFGVVRSTGPVLEDATRLTGVHGLRGFALL